MGRWTQLSTKVRQAYAAGRASVRAARIDETELMDRPAGDDLAGSAAAPPAEPAPPAEAAPPVVAAPSVNSRDDAEVPHGLRIAAAWSWRLIVIAAAAAAVLWMIGRLHQVAIPVAISLLLAALLSPAVGFLRDRARMPRSLATALVMITGLAVIAGTLTLVITQFVNALPDLTTESQSGVLRIQQWLKQGPLHLSDEQLSTYLGNISNWVKSHQATLTTGAVSGAATALDVFASIFLILFTTFFLLRDGRLIWRFLVRLLPVAAREPLATAGERSWSTLVAYVRATVLVAFIDAVGIGIGLMLLRIDLAFPLAALVFLGAFIPIVGATLSGTVAVLVALVTHGPVSAFAVVAVVIGVQQLEGHVLQPLIMGRAVAVHPLAVIMSIATGVVLAGIIGALVAVPILAVLNTGVRHLVARRAGQLDPPAPEEVVVRS